MRPVHGARTCLLAALGLASLAHADEPPLELKMATEMAVPQASTSGRGGTQVGVRSARERLSKGTPDWTDTAIEVVRQFDKRKLVIAGVTESSRFGLDDTTASLEGYYPLGERLTGYAGASASDTHRVLPRDTIAGQLALSLDRGWGVLGGWRQASYNTTTVDIVDLTLERYFSDYRAAFTVLPAHSRTAGNATSYRLAFGYYYGDENRVQLLYSSGTEVDRPVGVDLVIATRVRAAALFGRHWLSPSWALDYAVSRTVQGSVDRNGYSLGLRYRF